MGQYIRQNVDMKGKYEREHRRTGEGSLVATQSALLSTAALPNKQVITESHQLQLKNTDKAISNT